MRPWKKTAAWVWWKLRRWEGASWRRRPAWWEPWCGYHTPHPTFRSVLSSPPGGEGPPRPRRLRMPLSCPFAGLVLCKNSPFHFPSAKFGKITSLPTWYSQATSKAKDNRGVSLTVVFISTEGWARSFLASRNSMFPSRILSQLLPNSPKPGSDALMASLRWGLPW